MLFLLFGVMTATDWKWAPRSLTSISVVITLSSALVMGSEGIYYEAAVDAVFGEVSHDTGEASVGAFLCLVFNGFGTLFLVLSSSGVAATTLTWLLGAACVCAWCILNMYQGGDQAMKRSALDR